MTEKVCRLELHFGRLFDQPNLPLVHILVDGEERLADTGRTGRFTGFEPRELLDTGAMLPEDPPRRVALYRCQCGEPGCGCVAYVISQSGDRVLWSDARDFVGVFHAPLLDDELESDGRPLGVDGFVFDAEQYLDEVDRATSDRSWETPALLTARLLAARLDAARQVFVDRGDYPGWIVPWWENDREFRAEFVGPSGQIVVGLSPTASTPDAGADEMAAQLVESSPDQWRVTDRYDWPDDMIQRTIANRSREKEGRRIRREAVSRFQSARRPARSGATVVDPGA